MRSNRICALAVSLACALVMAPAALAETLSLDSYDPTNNDNLAGPVTSSTTLTAGKWYEVTATGTYSLFKAANWTSGKFARCDTAEPAPMTPSPGTTNGPVGADAEVFFATLRTNPLLCPDEPTHNEQFRMDLGSGLQHREPVSGAGIPNDDHEYDYLVLGQGSPASFAIRDFPTNDNYGVLSIELDDVDKDDCKKGGWEDFGTFKNQGDCVSYMNHH